MFMMQFGNTIKIFESQDFLHKYSRITQCQSHSFLNWNMEVYGTTLDMHMQTVEVSTLAYDLSCFKCKARLREKLVDEFLYHLNTLINIRTQINRQHSRRYKYSL